jgi:AdoMet-dependent heme synthase
MEIRQAKSLTYEITAQCNQKCSFCYNYWRGAPALFPEDLPADRVPELIRRIAFQFRRLSLFTISGGEPFLRSDLFDVIAWSRKAFPHARVNLATNGLSLDPGIAFGLKKAGLDGVQLTLLSARPGIHDGMTGEPGSFDRVIRAIAAAGRAGINPVVFFVATSRNIMDLPGTVKLAFSLGARGFIFNRFQPGGANLVAWKELSPSAEMIREALSRIRELRSIGYIGLGTLIPPCESTGKAGAAPRIMKCPLATTRMYPVIGPDGSLRVCNHSTASILNLLEGPGDALIRATVQAADRLSRQPPRCGECAYLKKCGGGCPLVHSQTGEFAYDRA